MNYAVDILNSPYGPLLQHLIFGKSPSLEAQIKSLPKTKFPLYEGSYPTYPGSGGVHDGKGSYPNIDIFEDGPSPYPEDRTWGVPKISNNRTMDFKDRNGNGIDDRDERGLPNSNGSTFIVPPETSDDDIDQILLRRSGLLGRF